MRQGVSCVNRTGAGSFGRGAEGQEGDGTIIPLRDGGDGETWDGAVAENVRWSCVSRTIRGRAPWDSEALTLELRTTDGWWASGRVPRHACDGALVVWECVEATIPTPWEGTQCCRYRIMSLLSAALPVDTVDQSEPEPIACADTPTGTPHENHPSSHRNRFSVTTSGRRSVRHVSGVAQRRECETLDAHSAASPQSVVVLVDLERVGRAPPDRSVFQRPRRCPRWRMVTPPVIARQTSE